MKFPSFFRVLLIAVAGVMVATDLSATGESTILTGWTVAGTNVPPLIRDQAVTLPAGAQISRTFTGGAVIAHLVTRPAFKVASDEWPILGLGPVALVFRPEDGAGHLLLASASGAVNPIPVRFPLDSTDRSKQPVEVFLAYDPSSGLTVIAVDGQVWSFTQMASQSSVEAMLAAGANESWTLDVLEAEVLTVETASTSKPSATAPRSMPQAAVKPMADQVKSLIVRAPTIPVNSLHSVVVAVGAAQAKPRASTLEIFTPPAIRSFGAAAVRATVRQAGK